MSVHDPDQQYRSWLIKAPLGLVLTGLGASLISDAAVRKYSGAATAQWMAYGTLALTVFNSGLSILADAAKHRGHYERLRESDTSPAVPAKPLSH